MTFLPGGDPKIPNQLPNPYGSPSLGASSSAPQQTEPSAPLVTSAERQRALARLFIRLAVIGAVLLGGATIIAFVAPGLDSPTNVAVVLVAAAIDAVIWVVAIMRHTRRYGGSVLLSVADRPVASDSVGYRDAQVQDAPFQDAPFPDAPFQDAPAYGVAAFHLVVEDVFSITGRGTVATGRVAAGTLSPGQVVSVVRLGTVIAQCRVTSIEAFRRQVEVAQPGENIGLVLEGISREDVRLGDVLAG